MKREEVTPAMEKDFDVLTSAYAVQGRPVVASLIAAAVNVVRDNLAKSPGLPIKVEAITPEMEKEFDQLTANQQPWFPDLIAAGVNAFEKFEKQG